MAHQEPGEAARFAGVRCYTCKRMLALGDPCNNPACPMCGKTNREQHAIERQLAREVDSTLEAALTVQVLPIATKLA